ncbi:uncharacterized protein G2W53_026374 [Senna tora]|uniref:Uncharacterized protein n=1 Tax=Senna tora TaxID=362788 RepID=A0A834TNU5_9FABA|nr:uncharacterized protein G2W53_026374 [Senna tora]
MGSYKYAYKPSYNGHSSILTRSHLMIKSSHYTVALTTSKLGALPNKGTTWTMIRRHNPLQLKSIFLPISSVS